MINDKYKFIFIHVPKTGGLAVTEALMRVVGIPVPPRTLVPLEPTGHAPISHHDVYPLEKVLDYNTFAFVRNPWDRAVSMYHYWRQTFKQSRVRQENPRITALADELSFTQWVRSVIAHEQFWFFANQFNYLNFHGKVGVDFLGRFENLRGDFEVITKEIGLPYVTLPHTNKSDHKPYRELYDDESKKVIAKKYETDIDLFKYTF
jgi:hypothetical protein